jgi:DMSO/TMAO reductase YedYZ heme-binding membrane subunit
MALTRQGYVIAALILLLFAAVNALALSTPADSTLGLALRLCALNGYLALAIAAMMTPFLAKVGRTFGKPFIGVHHVFAIAGLILVTLHPVLLAVLVSNPLVFLPSGTSPWAVNAGRFALILLCAALVGALLRTSVKQWRYLHALVYAVLLLGFLHASTLGTDFGTTAIRALYTLLFAGVVLTLVVSLWRKARRARSRAPAP